MGYAHQAYVSACIAPIITLALLYLIYGLGARTWSLDKIWEGYDGQASTSKFQFFCWTIVIFAAYVAIFAAKTSVSASSALVSAEDVPRNILTVLGFSMVTATTAKGITASYVASGRVTKTGSNTASGLACILQDDTGAPDLSKIQMVGWTLIAIVIYAFTVFYQIKFIGTPANFSQLSQVGLPDIDPSLLVLMGLGQGAYLGKKLVTTSAPRLTGVSPSAVTVPTATSAPQTIAINGSGFDDSQGGNQILIDGSPYHGVPSSWSDTCVQFGWPATQATGTPWSAGQTVSISLLVDGQSSNAIPVILVSPAVQVNKKAVVNAPIEQQKVVAGNAVI